MAILLDFHKVREDGQEVEYVFGEPTNPNRRLVVEKQSQTAVPLDGNRDKDYTRVVVKVLRFYRSEGSWPQQGSYAA